MIVPRRPACAPGRRRAARGRAPAGCPSAPPPARRGRSARRSARRSRLCRGCAARRSRTRRAMTMSGVKPTNQLSVIVVRRAGLAGDRPVQPLARGDAGAALHHAGEDVGHLVGGDRVGDLRPGIRQLRRLLASGAAASQPWQARASLRQITLPRRSCTLSISSASPACRRWRSRHSRPPSAAPSSRPSPAPSAGSAACCR